MNSGISDKPSPEVELTAFQIVDNPPVLRPASARRSWMSETDESYAYLCLPLVAANVSGWEILSPTAFTAIWDGGKHPDAVQINSASNGRWTPLSHFGHGILTLNTGYVFRTSPGHNLWVKGPTNECKDGLTPLEGLIETDWLPYGFTMNYRFTRPHQMIRFDAGEAFCVIHPMPSDYLMNIKPVLRRLSADPLLQREHRAWGDTRRKWNRDRLIPASAAAREKWRKDYLRGQTATGKQACAHGKAAGLTPFEDRRELR